MKFSMVDGKSVERGVEISPETTAEKDWLRAIFPESDLWHAGVLLIAMHEAQPLIYMAQAAGFDTCQ